MAMSALRVEPSKLKAKAAEFSQDGKAIDKITKDMFTTVNALNGAVWSGDAQKAYTSRFKKLQDDVANMLKIVNEYSNDLTAIANEYMKAEKENQAASSKLKTDVISY